MNRGPATPARPTEVAITIRRKPFLKWRGDVAALAEVERDLAARAASAALSIDDYVRATVIGIADDGMSDEEDEHAAQCAAALHLVLSIKSGDGKSYAACVGHIDLEFNLAVTPDDGFSIAATLPRQLDA